VRALWRFIAGAVVALGVIVIVDRARCPLIGSEGGENAKKGAASDGSAATQGI
jgi:hypothetical protein